MIWRLLLGVALGYLGYQVIRKVGRSLGRGGRPRADREVDMLVQDPVCGTFIPRKEALKIHKNGKDYFFCSEGCLKRFQRGETV